MEEPVAVVAGNEKSRPYKHRGLIVALMAALLFFAGGAYYEHRSGDAQASNLVAGEVIVTKTGFSPATIRIKKGQQVIWQNDDTQPHQVTSDTAPALSLTNATILSKNDTATVTFEKAGTYQYYDNLSASSFQGTVIVE